MRRVTDRLLSTVCLAIAASLAGACGAGEAKMTVDGGTCVVRSCQDLGAACGAVDDGCGTTLSCGECAGLNTCGGGGTANQCGCTPTTCAAEGAECGTIIDGCGGTVTCTNTCTDTETCGGGGAGANRCGTGTCTPTTCAAEGAECGTVSDGCSGTLSCGSCGTDESCNSSNQCVCSPRNCTALGAECGSIDNGCGANLSCGSCNSPETCGGAGTANQCGCNPTKTCVSEGAECGSVDDGCGNALACGSCTGPEVCGADNQCGLANNTATLTWEPNNALGDLSGFEVHYGATSSGGNPSFAYDVSMSISGTGICSATTCTYMVSDLASGTYYFAVKAYKDSNKSAFSNEASKTF